MTRVPKLLVAQADPDVGRSLQRTFEDRGWEVVLASDARETVGAAAREQPRAIVLGAQLPGGGVTALRRIRQIVHTTAIPVVGLAANDAEREALRVAGAQACVGSPPALDALAALVDGYAGRPLAVTEAPADALRRPSRLAAIEETGLREQPADDVLDGLAALAASLLDVPVALATLVDHDRQRFAGQVGLETRWATERQTPLSYSFCQWVVAADEPLAVTDARSHPALCANPAVQELGVVAYAGMPMEAASGETIGSFCAIDSEPHVWTEDELALLGDLSSIAEGYVASRAPIVAPAAERGVQARKAVERVRATTRMLRRRDPALTDGARTLLLELLDRQAAHLARLLDARS